MTLRAICPACGCRADIEAFLVEEAAKRLAARFADLDPAFGRAVLAYLRFFKPLKTELRSSRAALVIDQLVALIEPGTVCADERNGQRLPAPIAVWTEALEEMIATPPSGIPLGNHNYLRKVAYSKASEHQARPAAVSRAPALRPTGMSPSVAVDRTAETIEFLATQLRYGKIAREEHDQRVAELRGVKS